MKNTNTLKKLSQSQLESIADDPSHDLYDLANEHLSETAGNGFDSHIAQELGFRGNTDYFSISPAL